MSLEDEGDDLAEQLGVVGCRAMLARARELLGLPEAWHHGWFEDSTEIQLGHEVLVAVRGRGVSWTARERSVGVLLVWALMPERPVELDAWASTVLLSWGWRIEGSRVR